MLPSYLPNAVGDEYKYEESFSWNFNYWLALTTGDQLLANDVYIEISTATTDLIRLGTTAESVSWKLR